MTEQQIQKKIVDYLEKQGAYVVKVIKAAKAGTPDLIACLNGKFYGFEVKGERGKVSKLQEYHLKKIAQSEGLCGVVRSVDDVKKIISCFAIEG